MSKSRDPNSFLPLTTGDLQVLTLLAEQRLHGYGMIRAARSRFADQPALDIGSLYRIISRMSDQGLIEEVEPPAGSPADRRARRYYRATRLGGAVLSAEAARLRSLLAAAGKLDPREV